MTIPNDCREPFHLLSSLDLGSKNKAADFGKKYKVNHLAIFFFFFCDLLWSSRSRGIECLLCTLGDEAYQKVGKNY